MPNQYGLVSFLSLFKGLLREFEKIKKESVLLY